MISVLYRQYFLKYNYGYYTGALDGIEGAQTKAATKKFQNGYGLSVDGIWGAKTDAKAVSVTKELQTLLNKYGAGLTVDGVLGQKTAAAIKTVQKKLGLTADGCAGQATWGCAAQRFRFFRFCRHSFRRFFGAFCKIRVQVRVWR